MLEEVLEMDNTFAEISIFQIKPVKVEEVEMALKGIVEMQRVQEGLLDIKYVKREYRIELSEIQRGLHRRS